MDTWLDRLASALGQEPVSAGETSQILTVAREVAHGVERRITPVATYLLGVAVGRQTSGAADRSQALGAGVEALRSILPEEPPGQESE